MPALMAAFVDKVLVEGMSDWGRPLVLGMLATAVLRVFSSGLQLPHSAANAKPPVGGRSSSRFVWHLLRLPALVYFPSGVRGEVSGPDRSQRSSGRHPFRKTGDHVYRYPHDDLLPGRHVAVQPVVNFGGVWLRRAELGTLRWIARTRGDSNARLSMEQGKTRRGDPGLQHSHHQGIGSGI